MDHTWTDRETMYISYIGKLFLRMLKALILPLIIPSLVAAVGSLDMSLSGKVGGRLKNGAVDIRNIAENSAETTVCRVQIHVSKHERS